MQAGLFSSLLSAAIRRCSDDASAMQEARFLHEMLRNIVATLNTAARIARQYQDLAVRMVHESGILSLETKRHFFRNLLYSDEKSKRAKYGENGGSKIQQWFLKAVFGTSRKNAEKVNQNGHISNSQVDDVDPLEGFSQDGGVSDIPAVLAALPDDPYLKDLHANFSGDKVMGNIILAARRLWCQGFDERWDQYPELPSSFLLTPLIEELARRMDQETAANLTANFLSYQQCYLAKQMERLYVVDARVADKLAPELFTFLIDYLPLDNRPDLVKLKNDLAVDSIPEFQQFIMQERQELASMMGVSEICKYDTIEAVDDTKVDIRYALGFGDHKCIQADFLLPAILSMGNKVKMPITAIPNAGTRNRVLLFNSRATSTLMDNLGRFAEKFGMDISIAKDIEKKYKIAMTGAGEETVEYDLRKLSFLINVSIIRFISFYPLISSIANFI